MESKKARISVLEARLKEYERSVRELQRNNEKLKADKDKERREKNRTLKERDQDIKGLKETVRSLRARAEKAEMDRAIAESKIGSSSSSSVGDGASTSCTSAAATDGGGFFRDVMANFKELVETNLQCSVCSELLVFASTVRCGHSFCEACIREWIETKGAARADCPMCRAPVHEHHPNQAVDAYIDKVVDNFYTEEARSARGTLVDERKAKRAEQDERRGRGANNRERDNNARPRPGTSAGGGNRRVFGVLVSSSGTTRPMRQLVIDSDSTDSDVSWSPSHAIRSVTFDYSPIRTSRAVVAASSSSSSSTSSSDSSSSSPSTSSSSVISSTPSGSPDRDRPHNRRLVLHRADDDERSEFSDASSNRYGPNEAQDEVRRSY